MYDNVFRGLQTLGQSECRVVNSWNIDALRLYVSATYSSTYVADGCGTRVIVTLQTKAEFFSSVEGMVGWPTL